jgi:signal transduction histidine kinase
MRILQEALTNVFKHSRASQVEIELHSDELELALAVRDNGIGFDPAALQQHAGTGMRSMQARAQRLGGTLRIRSAAGLTALDMQVARAETESLPR